MKIDNTMSTEMLSATLPEDYQSAAEQLRYALLEKHSGEDLEDVKASSPNGYLAMLDQAKLCQLNIDATDQDVIDLMPGGAAHRNGVGDASNED